jgi:hypothetical protein
VPLELDAADEVAELPPLPLLLVLEVCDDDPPDELEPVLLSPPPCVELEELDPEVRSPLECDDSEEFDPEIRPTPT